MSSSSASAFAGFRFPREVISVAVRWCLRYGLSYRDVEELLAERGVNVDHVTVYRWVQRFTPEFVEAARPRRHMPGDRGSSTRPTSRSTAAGRTCTGRSTSSGRSSTCGCPPRRDMTAARIFFIQTLATGAVAVEVITDRGTGLPADS